MPQSMKSVCCLVLFIFLMPAQAAEKPVTLKPISELVFYPEFSAPAEVLSRQDSVLSAEINAKIDGLEVEVGDQVLRGDRLINLDCQFFESQLSVQQAVAAEIAAQKRLAADQLKRAERLSRSGNIGQDILEQRQTEFRVLEARVAVQQQQINLAEIAVQRCSIEAPFDALIAERHAQLGALAAPGTPLLRLIQLDSAVLSVKLPAKVDLTMAQNLNFDVYGQNYPVVLDVVIPLVDTEQRTREARLSFPEKIPPIGASGRLHWRSITPHLPSEMLERRRQGERWALGLLWAKDELAQFRYMPDAIEGQPVAVDFDDNIMLITGGRMLVEPGDQLNISPNEN